MSYVGRRFWSHLSPKTPSLSRLLFRFVPLSLFQPDFIADLPHRQHERHSTIPMFPLLG